MLTEEQVNEDLRNLEVRVLKEPHRINEFVQEILGDIEPNNTLLGDRLVLLMVEGHEPEPDYKDHRDVALFERAFLELDRQGCIEFEHAEEVARTARQRVEAMIEGDFDKPQPDLVEAIARGAAYISLGFKAAEVVRRLAEDETNLDQSEMPSIP